MERWSGKTAVVTGASSGIGAALCLRLAELGVRVVGLARRANRIDEIASKVQGSGSVVSRQCDVSKPEEIKAAFQWVEDEFGGTDILVNNAGIFVGGNITDIADRDISDDAILSIIDTNFKGMVICTRQAVASMKRRNFNGHIINVSSLAGLYIPFSTDFNVYSATKHAVTAFNTALLNELADFNSHIKVTCVSPGLTRTGLIPDHKDGVPILECEEVADVIVYVISTPPNVNIREIGLGAVAEKRL